LKINADLHSHSTASDGLLAPAELVRLAHGNGVTLLSLTDHDDTSGLAEAAAAARECGVTFIPGVEISVSWRDHTIHIVGLGIDAQHPALIDGLAWVRGSRVRRARRISDELAREGIRDAFEGALSYAANPDVVSRTHFARFLAEAGHARDVKSVFQRFLASGKPGYVGHEWAPLADAVGWIRASGGTAVIAHPGRYSLTDPDMARLIEEFMGCGGEGIEVLTGSHAPNQYKRFAKIARQHGLAASRGSDYHGPGESRLLPGSLPELPVDLVPVWRRF
jgi:predicted metal-dependent phosphoesterase TrpH